MTGDELLLELERQLQRIDKDMIGLAEMKRLAIDMGEARWKDTETERFYCQKENMEYI